MNRELHGRNGETRNIRVEDGVSDHPKKSGRKGHAGGGPEEDEMLRLGAVALEYQVREDRARAPVEAGQPVGQNHPEGPGSVDGGCLEEGYGFPIQREGMAT